VVQPAVRQMLKVGFDFVTFTSGTALAVARMAEGSAEKVADARGRSGEGMGRHLVLKLDNLRALEQRLIAATPEERAAMPGVGAMRADTVVPGTIMLRTLLELTGQRTRAHLRKRAQGRPGGRLLRAPANRLGRRAGLLATISGHILRLSQNEGEDPWVDHTPGTC
jgi:hypothetical protein